MRGDGDTIMKTIYCNIFGKDIMTFPIPWQVICVVVSIIWIPFALLLSLFYILDRGDGAKWLCWRCFRVFESKAFDLSSQVRKEDGI